jgi:hypothetical protein
MQFWINEPTILFDKKYILDLYPTSSMCYEQQMNSVSRLIILITILSFMFTGSWKVILSGAASLALICVLYTRKFLKPSASGSTSKKAEGFQEYSNSANADIPTVSELNRMDVSEDENIVKPYNDDKTVSPISLDAFVKSEYQMGSKKNPFANVLLTDIMDDPKRKAAPPSFHPDILEDITSATKKTVQMLNPGIKNTNNQLFGSMTDKFYLDQSNRTFFSTANTKVVNDQGAFADFLYGDMPSCRDGDAMACVQDNYRYTLY